MTMRSLGLPCMGLFSAVLFTSRILFLNHEHTAAEHRITKIHRTQCDPYPDIVPTAAEGVISEALQAQHDLRQKFARRGFKIKTARSVGESESTGYDVV